MICFGSVITGDGVPQPQTLRSLPKLPPATLPPPPPPPLITTMRPGDRIPNLVHRRLVSAQFRQLDVHLRKAVCSTYDHFTGSVLKSVVTVFLQTISVVSHFWFVRSTCMFLYFRH